MGLVTIYRVVDRQSRTVCLCLANGAENAIRLCQANGFPDWSLANTFTRRIQAGVLTTDAPRFIESFRLEHKPRRHKRKDSHDEG